MADHKQNQKSEVSPAVVAAPLPKGFKSIAMNEPAYHVDGTLPAIGFLVDYVRMPDAKDDAGNAKAWHGLRMVATQPTQGQTRDGEVVDIPVGGRFFIGDSKALDREDLIAAALHPTHVREVYIKCLSKTKIAGTAKTFRTFEIALTDENHSRGIPALANIARPLALPATMQARQLAPNGTAVAGAGTVALSDN